MHDDTPSTEELTRESWILSSDDCKSTLYSFCQDIVGEYIDVCLTAMTCESDAKLQEYAKEVTSLGMFYLNYKDAIK